MNKINKRNKSTKHIAHFAKSTDQQSHTTIFPKTWIDIKEADG